MTTFFFRNIRFTVLFVLCLESLVYMQLLGLYGSFYHDVVIRPHFQARHTVYVQVGSYVLNTCMYVIR